MASFLRLALLVTAFTFAFVATQASADDDEAGPAMGHSVGPDGMTAESQDFDDLEGQSRSSDDLLVGSEDPDDMVGGDVDPDDMVGDSEDPDARVGHSSELDDLAEDSGRGNLPDPLPQLVAEPSPPGPDDGSQVHAAWRSVQAAERNMEAANDSYSNMIENDYPRGAQRARIIEERRAAFEEVNRARRRYNELRGN